MRDRDNVLLVTHSGVVLNLFRLYGVIQSSSLFFPVPLASVYVLRVPFE
jgi:broad specificity phosphatase PhoE